MPFLYKKIDYRGESCIEITGFEGTARSLTIPDRLEGLPVRRSTLSREEKMCRR